MKNFSDLTFDERKELLEILTTWLNPYTHEVILRVVPKIDEIINDETTMMMLRELHERTKKEINEFERDLEFLIKHTADFADYDIHNHCLTHANSYRQVLYDMYIDEH